MRKRGFRWMLWVVLTVVALGISSAACAATVNMDELGVRVELSCDLPILYQGETATFCAVPDSDAAFTYNFMLYGADKNEQYTETEIQDFPVLAQETNQTGVFTYTTALPSGIYWLAVYISDADGHTQMISEYYVGGARAATDPNTVAGKVEEIVALCSQSGATSDLEIARFMHDYLILHAQYDDENQNKQADGVLLRGIGDCTSYAYAYQILLTRMGIPCITVTGTADGEGHMWNMVRIGEKWGHVDVTWDDHGDTPGYGYFYIKDSTILTDHTWERSHYRVCDPDTSIVDIAAEFSADLSNYIPTFLDRYDNVYTRQDFLGHRSVIIEGTTTCPFTPILLDMLPEYIDWMRAQTISLYVIISDASRPEELDAMAERFPFALFLYKTERGSNIYYGAGLPSSPYYATPSLYATDDRFRVIGYAEGASRNSILSILGVLQAQNVAGIFSYDRDANGELTITGYTGKSNNIAIPDSINGSPVTALADALFMNNTDIKAISIPDCVTNIGKQTFKGATGLENVTFPSGLTEIGESVFEGCTSLYNIYLPRSLTTIGTACFKDSIIGSLYMYENISYIAPDAFLGCRLNVGGSVPLGGYADEAMQNTDVNDMLARVTSVNGIHYAKNSNNELWAVGCDADLEEAVIPSTLNKTRVHGVRGFHRMDALRRVVVSPGINTIDDAFNECGSLREVILNEGLYSIRSSFGRCGALLQLDFPDTLISVTQMSHIGVRHIAIPGSVMKMSFGSPSFETVTLMDGITEITYESFGNCVNLRAITIPASVTSISVKAFSEMYSLTTVYTVPGSAADAFFRENYPQVKIVYPHDAMDGSLTYALQDGAYTVTNYVGNPVEITVPETVDGHSVKAVAAGAFANCATLEKIVIGGRVTMIGDGAFENCAALTTVQLSEKTKRIGERAFAGCQSLARIEIPDSVTKLGAGAFENCPSLASAALSCSLDTLSECAFSGCTALTRITIKGNVTIASRCFSGSGLREISFTEPYCTIASDAFSDCLSLTQVRAAQGGTVAAYFDGLGITVAEPDASYYYQYTIQNGQCVIHGNMLDRASSDERAHIVIPEYIDGYPVVALDDEALFTEAAGGAVSLTLPDSLTRLGGANLRMPNLTTLHMNEGLLFIERWTGVALYSLKRLIIPDTVIFIGDGTFMNAYNVTELHLSENLTSLEMDTFSETRALKEVVIPAGIEKIGHGCFKNSGLETVTFMGMHVELSDNYGDGGDGVFYHDDGTTNPLKTVRMHKGCDAEAYFRKCLPDVTIEYFDAPVASVTVNRRTDAYVSMPDAISAIMGKTAKMTLYADSTILTGIALTSGALTLDLNGHVLTAQSGDALCVSEGATLTVLDGADGGGLIANGEDCCAVRADGGRVTLCGGTYQSKNAALYSSDSVGAMLDETCVAKVDGEIAADCTSTLTALYGVVRVMCDYLTDFHLNHDQWEQYIPAGSSMQIPVTDKVPQNAREKIRWTILNSPVYFLELDEHGVIMGKAPGTADIYAKTEKVQRSVRVHICEPIDGVTFDRTDEWLDDTVCVASGQSVQLYARATSGDIYWRNQFVAFKSSDTTVATVDAQGVVHALAPGNTTITATADGGLTATCLVTVHTPDTGAELNIEIPADVPDEHVVVDGKLILSLNTRVTPIATVLPASAEQGVVWTSANKKIASVDEHTGEITGKSPGETVITATCACDDTIKKEIAVQVVRPITALTMPETATVFVGKVVDLTPVIAPTNATLSNLTWTIEGNDGEAEWSEAGEGRLRGLKQGAVTVKARAYNGMEAVCAVTIIKQAEAVEAYVADGTAAEIGAKETLQLAASVDGIAEKVAWSSANAKIAKVDEDGLVTGVKNGTTTITAMALDGSGAYDTIDVIVITPVTKIAVSGDQVVVAGGSTQLKATLAPKKPTYASVTWASSDIAIARVDPTTGMVAAIEPGIVTIKATAQDRYRVSETYEIRVVEPTTAIAITGPNASETVPLGKNTVGVKGILQLTAVANGGAATALQAFDWTTSNKKIATVDDFGAVKGVKISDTPVTITATAKDDASIKATFAVTVRTEITGLALNKTEWMLRKGEQYTLKATVLPTKGVDKTVAWASDNPSVATVENGVVTALGKGMAYITATTVGGEYTAVCVLTVVEPTVTSVTVRPISVNEPTVLYTVGNVGRALVLEAVVTPAESNATVTWKTSGSAVTLTPDPDNPNRITVTGAKAGKATITATATDGSMESDTHQVTVKTAVDSVRINKPTLALYTRKNNTTKASLKKAPNAQTLKATASPKKGALGAITWRIASVTDLLGVAIPEEHWSAYLTVDAKGTVTALTDCLATVRATTQNGFTADSAVTVTTLPGAMGIGSLDAATQKGELLIKTTVDLTPFLVFDESSDLVAWKTSNKKIATVLNGIVKGVKTGTAKITATAPNGKSVVWTIHVVKALSVKSLAPELAPEPTPDAPQTGSADIEIIVAEDATDDGIIPIG